MNTRLYFLVLALGGALLPSGAMAMRFIKQGALAVVLLVSVQSVWAACEAEIQQATERQLDIIRKVSPGHEAFDTEQQRNYWIQIEEDLKKAGLEGLNDGLKYRTNYGDLLRKQYRSSPTYQLDTAENDARLCLIKFYLRASPGSATPSAQNPKPSPSTASNLDTAQSWQAAQANQQQADRAFAGTRRSNDVNANTDQPAPGPSEGMATNRGRVRVNMAYCIDSDKRPYTGSLKCSAQRFGAASVEPGASVQVLLPNSGLQALTFACTHPARPYDVTFANNGLTGRFAAF